MSAAQPFRLGGYVQQARRVNAAALAQNVPHNEVEKTRGEIRELIDWLRVFNANLPRVSP